MARMREDSGPQPVVWPSRPGLAKPLWPSRPGLAKPLWPSRPRLARPLWPSRPRLARPLWPSRPGLARPLWPSRPRLGNSPPGRHCHAAFTLVELLVVIVIIAILIGLLVPAVGAVRRVAREAASKAALSSIENGIETFKADQRIGGSYPPSASDWFADQEPMVISPVTGQNMSISGAGLLVWALAGADFLGTPGFIKTRNRLTWGQSSGRTYVQQPVTDSDAYALDNNGQPVFARSGPYVELAKLAVTQNVNAVGSDPDFVIPAERDVVETGRPRRAYAMFLDGFGYPILYYRADPAGRVMADWSTEPPVGNTRGIYHCGDNDELVWTQSSTVLRLNKADEPHALDWGTGNYTVSNPPPLGTFQAYVLNKSVSARLEPQRPDSYLLVSPGADGRYGTADDVTNFQHNGK